MVKSLKEMTRAELSEEFKKLFAEARARGDNRPRLDIFNEWLKFRREQTKD